MKIHLRDNYSNTEANREKFKKSPHVMYYNTTGHRAVCGLGTSDDTCLTDELLAVECIACKRADEASFVRGVL